MPFDSQTRNRLARFVTDARVVIADEFTQKFQSLHGLSSSGETTPLTDLKHLDEEQRATAERLRARLHHLEPGAIDQGSVKPETMERLAREQAFTVLNRLAAIRMAEKRGIIIESVGHGYESKGFKVYLQVAGTALGETYAKYRRYLFCLFDELAVDLGALFDRRSSSGLLFLREPALLQLLQLLNAPDLESLWAEDETIGWIYQYYNDPTERKKMRDQSSAPRNSRELAVRNQFFTPRYVVEFLTDSTLGRIWYEMTKGRTRLKVKCRYLVRRPNEIFLRDGETAPEPANSTGDNVSQEELLKQPVHIPHRSFKDPREIRMLDPACGSMHFGLYSFDLFEVIYDEAWEIAHSSDDTLKSSEAFAPFVAFAEQYSDKAAFLREVPRLIIEHNIHGIDIDARCAQIAGLSLWLRAQRTWQQQRLQPADRPQVRRSNIVCAEPMPGEEAFLNEFIEAQLSSTAEKNLLGQLVRRVFDAMELAGEAGSILKIEGEIAVAVNEAKQKWLAGPKLEQGRLFADDTVVRTQKELGFDVTGIDDETFWERAEERIYVALQEYAEQAEYGGYQRRLFADDAARGFAFIDLCRKRYDVVLMNPPFGPSTASVREYIDISYPVAKNDIAAVVVERGAKFLAHRGILGAITTRNVLNLPTYESWRIEVLLRNGQLSTLADLGYGVLDNAVVETAAYVLGPESGEFKLFFSCLDSVEKDVNLSDCISAIHQGFNKPNTFLARPQQFLQLPAAVLAYSIPELILERILKWPCLKESGVIAYKGLNSSDDAQFLRLAWEPAADQLGNGKRWRHLAKGGEWNPFWDDIHLAIDWSASGERILLSGGTIRNPQMFFRHGLTYPQRTTSSFGPRILPKGCIFSTGGLAILFPANLDPLVYMGLLLSRPGQFLVEMSLGGGDSSVSGTAARNYTNGMVNRLPFPSIPSQSADQLKSIVERITALKRVAFVTDETSRDFVGISLKTSTFVECVKQFEINRLSSLAEVSKSVSRLERIALEVFGLDDALGKSLLSSVVGPPPQESEASNFSEAIELWKLGESELVQRLVQRAGKGARYITKNNQLVDRRLELVAHISGTDAARLAEVLSKEADVPSHLKFYFAKFFSSYVFGCAFGRWDICFATGEKVSPELPEAFAPLPVCPPGQLQNERGEPLTKDDVRHLQAANLWHYPLDPPWDSILVDDPGHQMDFEARIHQALQVVWKARWEEIEHEVCEFLGVATLRDYFRMPAGFFADHLSCYSKSRRQAPIYWPLSTTSGSYTLWLYYPRLTSQTLHTALADFLEPKIKSVELDVERQREEGRTQRYGESIEFLDELRDLRAEIERIINLPWKPNLNDGVLITASPLWKVFRLGKWQKDLKTCWEALEAGDYDWAHLAYTIWPERVKEKCKTDRSLAIAHGLEELCTIEPPKTKKGTSSKKKTAEEEGTDLVQTEAPLEVAPKTTREFPVASEEISETRPIPIDQTDRMDVLCAIRQIFNDGQTRHRDTAIRDVAVALGYERVGSRIRETLHRDLLTAVRRGILQNQDGQLSLLARDLRDYQRDFLKENFLGAIGRAWMEREEAIRAFARWLGFSRVGPVIEETGRSLINGLLRDGRLEANKDQVRRVAT